MSWRLIDGSTLEDWPGLIDALQRFRSIDTEVGREATRWLAEEALANDGSTKTYGLFEEDALLGFFSICAGEVLLTRRDARDLSVPERVRQPAVVLAWIARSRAAPGVGGLLLESAYGLARRVSREIGAVALVLDPGDETLADLWRDRGFRDSRPRFEGARTRLWAPLQLADDEG
jgi:hypothetical protein